MTNFSKRRRATKRSLQAAWRRNPPTTVHQKFLSLFLASCILRLLISTTVSHRPGCPQLLSQEPTHVWHRLLPAVEASARSPVQSGPSPLQSTPSTRIPAPLQGRNRYLRRQQTAAHCQNEQFFFGRSHTSPQPSLVPGSHRQPQPRATRQVMVEFGSQRCAVPDRPASPTVGERCSTFKPLKPLPQRQVSSAHAEARLPEFQGSHPAPDRAAT